MKGPSSRSDAIVDAIDRALAEDGSAADGQEDLDDGMTFTGLRVEEPSLDDGPVWFFAWFPAGMDDVAWADAVTWLPFAFADPVDSQGEPWAADGSWWVAS